MKSKMIVGGACSTYERDEKCIQIFMKGEGRDLIVRVTCEYNFKMSFQ
jgi:hypothetical protein